MNKVATAESSTSKRRGIYPIASVTALSLAAALSLTACSKERTVPKDVKEATKAVAGRYHCNVVPGSFKDLGHRPDDYPGVSGLDEIDLKVQLSNNKSVLPYLDQYGIPKNELVVPRLGPVVQARIARSVEGRKNKTIVYLRGDNDADSDMRPSGDDQTGVLEGKIYVRSGDDKPGSVADIIVTTMDWAQSTANGDHGQTLRYYGTSYCGSIILGASGATLGAASSTRPPSIDGPVQIQKSTD